MATYYVEVDNDLQDVHRMALFEPRDASNKAVEYDNYAPEVQDILSHG